MLNTITEFYQRNLPHLHPKEGTFFITTRLADSIPQSRIQELEVLKARQLNSFKLSKEDQRNLRLNYFLKFENSLDNPSNGPYWLSEDRIASNVAESLKYYDKTQYDLISFSIMSNHAHIVLQLLKDSLPLTILLQRHKRFTARECNKMLNRTGQFWHRESYDHLISNNEELIRVIRYTLNNPVKPGFVGEWKQWKWNYLSEEFRNVF
jgi:REP element-mobilizing transposase RayT